MAALAVGTATAARGQVPDPEQVLSDPTAIPDPGAEGERLAKEHELDTRHTPIAKDAGLIGWSQWAGDVHPEAPTPPDYEETVQNDKYPIPVTVDFYTVDFRNEHLGLAGGAQCAEDPPPGLSEADLEKYLHGENGRGGCVRVPVIYRFTDNTEDGPVWQEAYKGQGQGYVGGISWLQNTDVKKYGHRALAVGGDGIYPRREEEHLPPEERIWNASGCVEQALTSGPQATVDPGGTLPRVDFTKPFPWLVPGTLAALRDHEKELSDCEDRWRGAHDPAGMARAWLLSTGRWREQDVGARATPGSALSRMRGLTALDASERTFDCVIDGAPADRECALAGGLAQIWTWADGSFDQTPWEPRLDAEASPSRMLIGGRVSEVTECTNSFECDWHFRVRAIRFRQPDVAFLAASAVTAGCCSSTGYPSPSRDGGRLLTFSRLNQAWSIKPIRSSRETESRTQLLADSFFSLTADAGYTIAAPGGPQRPEEPPSQVIRANVSGSSLEAQARGYPLTTIRLVAGDGNLQGGQPNFSERAGINSGTSAETGPMDWAVGGFKTNGRGALYTTTTLRRFEDLQDPPYPLTCPLPGTSTTATPPEKVPSECQPRDDVAEDLQSTTWFQLSSYFLNGFTLVGNTGIGWAVGDRGAIARLAGEGQGAGGTVPPDEAPKVGAKRFDPAPARTPFETAVPEPTGKPSTVPSVASREPQKLTSPALASYGTPNPRAAARHFDEEVQQIVVSRDGSEGWAIGASQRAFSTTTLYQFDGTRWKRCNPDPIEDVLSADAACAELWPLYHHKTGVNISSIARIPTELGADPQEADEFEAIAAAVYPSRDGATPPNPILRYRDGRWTVDEKATAEIATTREVTDIAFSAPDDGWLITTANNLGGSAEIFHFDGERWSKCATLISPGSAINPSPDVKAECADANGFLPALQYTFDNGKVRITNAGSRLYLYGARNTNAGPYPFILHKDPGPCDVPGDSGCWQQGYDPGCASKQQGRCVPSGNPREQGELRSLSVAEGLDGSRNGWGIGFFGGARPSSSIKPRPRPRSHETPLIKLQADGESWAPASVGGPVNDYLLERDLTKRLGDPRQNPEIVALPGPDGRGRVFANTASVAGNTTNGPVVWLDPDTGRWRVLATPFASIRGTFSHQASTIPAIAADNSGGIWVVADPVLADQSWFYRFSESVPEEVFDDVAHPVREQIAAAAGGQDGSFWVATNSNSVYRYDRLTGWDRLEIRGWDRGRVVTRESEATAIAVGPDGSGLVVGESGRMAEIGPAGAILDAATGVLCGSARSQPCGTGRTLRAAAIAPDGAAMVGGDQRSLLYRPPGGEFAAPDPPPAAVYATITGISLPSAEVAYITTDTGQIWRGTRGVNRWSWDREDETALGDSITKNPLHDSAPLRAIAVDDDGSGYAVGDEGTILRRSAGAESPWTRLPTGYLENIHSVTLGPEGHGALVGGDDGLVLTEEGGGLVPARTADTFDPLSSGNGPSRVVGMALLPGYRDGQLEAWVASLRPPTIHSRVPAPTALLHYSSDPSEPLLDGGANRAQPLRDTPAPADGQIELAVFGNHGCQYLGSASSSSGICAEMIGTEHANEVIARHVRDAILERTKHSGSLLALATGDLGTYGGSFQDDLTSTPIDQSLIHRRWAELIAEPLLDAGVPVYAALGRRDLSEAKVCDLSGGYCFGTESSSYLGTESGRAEIGSSLPWRQGLATMPAPWGSGTPPARGGASVEGVQTGTPKLEPADPSVPDPTEGIPDQTVEDPTEQIEEQTVEDPTGRPEVPDKTTLPPHPGDTPVRGGQLGTTTVPLGGARTHYAFDLVRGGEPQMRVVVLDNSLGSLAATDPTQVPIEEQVAWMREVLESWPREKRAVVMMNTPTYSYGPGSLSDTATDGSALEAIMMAADVDLVVSGRMGWNGVYWAVAPGVHCPPPGGTHPDPNQVPGPEDCGGRGELGLEGAVGEAQKELLAPTGGGTDGPDPIPFVIASSAGVGPFGPNGDHLGSASNGFWHGHTEISLDPATDEPPVIEQRPALDWIGIAPVRNATHVLRPNQKLDLDGYGREAVGTDIPFRYDEINSFAVTHRFDLLAADPAKPWLPKQGEAEDRCDPYDCLDRSIGTIDRQSGDVRAGRGDYPRTFGIVQLSVDDESATYPVVFEPRSSFRTPAPVPPRPSLPPPPQAPSQPPQPGTPTVEPPPPPAIPPIEAPLALTPVIPPTPPSYGNANPIDLGIAPVAIVAPPPTVVLQPPNPVVQPAPPSGARREARQRQAATQKSGAEAANEAREEGVDLAAQPPGADGTDSMTRHEFTRVAREEPVSAWARDVLIGGGLGITALVLALGLSGARPTPRRRPPEVPAPAVARARRR